MEDQAKKMEERAKKNANGGTNNMNALDHDEVIVFDNDLIEELDEEDEEEIVEEYYEGDW